MKRRTFFAAMASLCIGASAKAVPECGLPRIGDPYPDNLTVAWCRRHNVTAKLFAPDGTEIKWALRAQPRQGIVTVCVDRGDGHKALRRCADGKYKLAQRTLMYDAPLRVELYPQQWQEGD